MVVACSPWRITVSVCFKSMSGAPAEVPKEHLDELGIQLAPPKEKPS